MLQMLRVLSCALLLGVSLACARETPMTLADCLEETLRNNAKIRAAQQEIKRAAGGVISARATLLPQISASGSVTMQDTDAFNEQPPPFPGFRDDWSVGLTLSQNLYSGGSNQNRLEIAKLTDQVASVRLQEVINEAVFEARKAFYDVLLAQSEIQVRKQTLELLEREVERQKNLFEAGRVTRFNILRTEVRQANELPELERASTQMQVARFTLLNVMGRAHNKEDDATFVLSGDFVIAPYNSDPNHLIRSALSRAPELTRQEKQIAIERLNTKIARASNIPRFDFFASSRLSQDESRSEAFFDNRTQATFGITGSWTLFDGFAGKGAAIQAESNARRLAIERDASLRRIEFDVRKALLEIRQAEASLRAQAGNVQKALQSIDLARSSVEAGFGTQFDVLQATVDLTSAQNIELRARYSYNVALANLERITFARLTTGDEPPLPGARSPLQMPAPPTSPSTPEAAVETPPEPAAAAPAPPTP